MKTTSNVKRGVLMGGIVLVSVLTLGGFAAAQLCVQPPVGLVSWWPGDGNANDIAGTNHGTLESGATFALGRVGQAFSFDGVDDYVEVPHDASLDIGTGFTFDAWIKADNSQSDQLWNVVDKAHHDPGIGWTCHGVENAYTPPGFPGNRATVPGEIFCSVGSGGTFTLVGTQTNVKDGQFHHIALVWTGAELQMNLDGVLKETNPLTGPVTNNTDPLRLGQTVLLGRPFRGLVDEAEFFNRALLRSEIQAIVLAGGAGKCNIEIDIKPGSFPNSINPRGKGTISVAILTTNTFDATTVDTSTVFFGATGTEAAPMHAALEDVDGDGDTDLTLHFSTQGTGIQCGHTAAALTGQTLGGQPIRGSDSIRTVGCK